MSSVQKKSPIEREEIKIENKEELNAQELGKEKQELEQDMQELKVDDLEKVSGSSWVGYVWSKIKSVE